VSAIRIKPCTSCKGRGYNWVFVSEWAEARERIVVAARRIWAAIWRKS